MLMIIYDNGWMDLKVGRMKISKLNNRVKDWVS